MKPPNNFKEALVDLELATVEVLKAGSPTGVTVELLPNDAMSVKGLGPEWPSWMKLEPTEQRISISYDGENWDRRTGGSELWALRVLDPRQLLRHGMFEKRGLGRVEAHLSMTSLYSFLFRPDTRHELPEVLPESITFKAKVTKKTVQIEVEFPVSREMLTLRAPRIRPIRSSS